MSKLDQFFRRKLEGKKQPDFDPAAWAAMEQMIERQVVAGSTSSGLGLWIGASALLVGGAGSAWYFLSDDEPIAEQIEQVEQVNSAPSTHHVFQDVSIASTAGQTTVDRNILSEEQASTTVDYQTGVAVNSAVTSSSPEVNTSHSNDQVLLASNNMIDGTPANNSSISLQQSSMLSQSSAQALLIDGGDIAGITPLALLLNSPLNHESALPEFANSKDKQSRFFNRRKKHFISIIGGNTFSQGYINSENERANVSYSQFGGVGYEYLLNARFSLNANLLYTSRSGLNSVREFEVIEYGFGFERKRVILNTKSLHYASLPLYGTMQLGAHGLIAGVDVAYLINAKSEYTSIVDNSYGVVSFDQRSEWGYMKGFNRFDAALIAGYEFGITEDLGVGIRARYGVMDVTRDEYFENEQRDRNLQLQVKLDYKLFGF